MKKESFYSFYVKYDISFLRSITNGKISGRYKRILDTKGSAASLFLELGNKQD